MNCLELLKQALPQSLPLAWGLLLPSLLFLTAYPFLEAQLKYLLPMKPSLISQL